MTQAAPAKTYYPWMDTLRGFGIVLVIWGHQKPSPEVMDYLQAIMLAVFIFASGFLFTGDRYQNAGEYFKKRARGLLIPYFWFGLLSFLFWVFFFGTANAVGGAEALGASGDLTAKFGGARPGLGVAIMSFVIPMVVASASLMWFNIPLWFFPGLFVIDGIFYWLRRWTKSDGALLALLVAASAFGLVLGRLHLRLPWNVDTASTIVLYYGLGYLFRKRYGEGWKMSIPVKIVAALAAFAVGLVAIRLNPGSHPSFNQLGRYFLYHIGAIASVLSFMLTAQLIAALKPAAGKTGAVARVRRAIPAAFDFIGLNSAVYVGAQVVAMGVIMTFNRFAFGIMAKEKLPSTPWAFYYGIGAMILLVPVTLFINRYAPFMLGKPRRKKAAG